MNRRELMLLLAGALTAPHTVGAQQKSMPVIGFLSSTSPEAYASRVAAFMRGLSEAGYVEGQNVAIEYRWAEGHYDRLPAMATDLVRRQVNVIAAITTPAAIAAKAATTTIPIVFEMGTDPVEAGLVASLNHPGGNLTGVSLLNVELAPKRLELLHEVTSAPIIGLLVNPDNRNAEIISRDVQSGASILGVQLHVLHAREEKELDTVPANLAALRAGGLVIGSDPAIALGAIMAGELVRLPVDVIVTDTQKSALIAHEATRAIPIVGATLGADPVAAGLATSLAHPGGNVTGFSGFGVQLAGKRLQLLKEASPAISGMAALWNLAMPISVRRATEEAVRTLGVQLRPIEVATPDQIPAGFEAAVAGGTEALVVLPDPMFWYERARIIALAAKYRMPAVYPEREYADDGGLLAYNQNVSAQFRRAAGYVDKILKGVKPADLPIQLPTKFELVVNLNTAKALGLTVPPSLLARADEVIE